MTSDGLGNLTTIETEQNHQPLQCKGPCGHSVSFADCPLSFVCPECRQVWSNVEFSGSLTVPENSALIVKRFRDLACCSSDEGDGDASDVGSDDDEDDGEDSDQEEEKKAKVDLFKEPRRGLGAHPPGRHAGRQR